MPDTGNAKTGAQATAPARGLEGVVVADTTLCMIDGTNGRLTYEGYSIDDLAAHASFEEVLYLLWYSKLPTRAELDAFCQRLVEGRPLSSTVMQVIRDLPRGGRPIDALRAAVTAMGMEDPDQENLAHDAVLAKAIHVAAAMPTMLAAYARLRDGKEPIDPDPELNHAANFLYMLHGERPTDLDQRAFNTYLVLLAEHSMNASTFSARVTISTISDYYAAIASALGTLKGDAHGGANQRTMEMLLQIGEPENIDEYVEESLRTKRRLMGLGHRIYKTRDPRVNHLMRYSEALSEEKGDRRWHDMAERLEQITSHHPYFLERKLYPNVEFYSAPLLYMLGFKTDMMPAIFALSRIGGWSAHVMEQLKDNRIIRPQAHYVGPEHQEWVPIDQRG
ncbi:MAG: tungsten formylmethanofuran dehydrogenase [Thermomicrobiaceae bacterium]|nr:tungsten formylmethanofuran dehydrogenase [Thermomicrobiaceae bacterium]